MVTLEGVDPRMIANNLEPFCNFHPGSYVKDEFDYLKISPQEAAEGMGISVKEVEDVINEKVPVTYEFAMLLEAYIGFPADTLINLQSDYDRLAAKRNKSFMKKLMSIRRVAVAL